MDTKTKKVTSSQYPATSKVKSSKATCDASSVPVSAKSTSTLPKDDSSQKPKSKNLELFNAKKDLIRQILKDLISQAINDLTSKSKIEKVIKNVAKPRNKENSKEKKDTTSKSTVKEASKKSNEIADKNKAIPTQSKTEVNVNKEKPVSNDKSAVKIGKDKLSKSSKSCNLPITDKLLRANTNLSLNINNNNQRTLEQARNVVYQWQVPRVKIITDIRYLGVVRADPKDYIKKYGNNLTSTNDLPQFIRNLRPPSPLLKGNSR